MTSELRTKARAFRRAALAVTFDGVRGEPPSGLPTKVRSRFTEARQELLNHARKLARGSAERARAAREDLRHQYERHELGELPRVRPVNPAAIERAAIKMLEGWLESCRGARRGNAYARGEPFPPKLTRALGAMLEVYDFAVSAELTGADQARTEISAAGGRAKARIVRAETGERDQTIRQRARQLQGEGRSRREIPGILASAFSLSARRIRDILKG